MTILQIKRELPATRCDICHQADCFDPETNVCARCEGIAIISEPTLVTVQQTPIFRTLSGYQGEASLLLEWFLTGLSCVPIGLFLLGREFQDRIVTLRWWSVAYVLAFVLLGYGFLMAGRALKKNLNGDISWPTVTMVLVNFTFFVYFSGFCLDEVMNYWFLIFGYKR